MSHTKPACFNLQDLRGSVRDQANPKLIPSHLTQAADSRPYLEKSHGIALFLLPLFICQRRRKAHDTLASQLRMFSWLRVLKPICTTWKPLKGRDMPIYLLPTQPQQKWVMLISSLYFWWWPLIGGSQLKPTWKTSQILAVALSSSPHDR